MDVLHTILVVIHWIFPVAIIAGPILAKGGSHPLQVWGARLQLLVGLALVGVNVLDDGTVNWVKIAVKLAVMVAVIACAEIAQARHKRDEKASPLPWVAVGLTVVNVLIAELW